MKLYREVIVPLEADVESQITVAANKASIALDRRRRMRASLDSAKSSAEAVAKRMRREITDALSTLTEKVNESAAGSIKQLLSEVETVLSDFERCDFTGVEDSRLWEMQQAREGQIDQVARVTSDNLDRLRDQLQSLVRAVADRETLDETTAALETTVESYREQLDTYIDLAQVGMAIGIVQHEFTNTIMRIRAAIGKLKPWADGTPALRKLYDELRIGFDHLDGYLRLFTPLSRRLHRTAIDISGEMVRRYLTEVFGDRLRRHNIDLVASQAFDQCVIRAYPSTLLAASVNVVDNAIYWITADKESAPAIYLDSDGHDFVISNGGPGIEQKNAERIFEYGETTKPGGRGIGLYLARESLRREGLDLTLDTAGVNVNPRFRISSRRKLPNSEANHEY